MTFSRSNAGLALLLVALWIAPLGGTTANAAEQNTGALSENGWYSDDTRADGTGTQAMGTNLISNTLTDDPEATASGSATHNADILQQIQFLVAPGVVPLGTHANAVNMNIAAGAGGGKSQISHRKDDLTGHGPGSGFGAGFSAEYSWMGNGTSTVTASLKFGIKTSEYGATGSSSRTGENAWDKVLIYEPGGGNGQISDGLWHTETISYTSGKWWFFDRTASAGTIATPLTLSDMSTSAILVGGGPKTIQDVYNLITAPGAIITSVQFGIGSGNAGGNVYVNQLETNVYRSGDVTTFGNTPVHNLTQATDHTTIQDGVDNALAGDVIAIDAGTYTEQVEIDRNLTLQGAGAGSTVIVAPNSMPLFFTTSANNHPVVYVHDAASVIIEDLTVDGLGRGNSNYRFVGIGYWNAGGRMSNLDVIHIEDTPFSGTQHGVALLAANNTGGPYSLEVDTCTFSDFQKNAMALTGSGLTVDVHDCATVGKGPTTITAQNGIQISGGAGGTVTDCAISDVDYTPSTYVASGLLTYAASTVAASGLNGANAIVDCQAPVSWYDTNGSMDGLEVSGGAQFGPIFVYNSSVAKSGQPGQASHAPVSAFDAEYVGKSGAPRLSASLAVSIANSCLTGTFFAGSAGVYALSNGGPLTVDVTNNIIADWDYGLVADGAATVLTANNNSITGNVSAGYDNSLSGSVQDAEFNWWGAADGPSGDGAGSGDVVTGGSVDFDPWLIDGTNTSGGCGFTTDNNLIAPNPPAVCISSVNPCVTVPFEISRSDNVPMRAYSVTFTLSANLQLCSGLGSIVEDTYLSSISGTQFLVLDNGGGSYTVDAAILGIPCGATAATGTLFNVGVTNSGGDGIGTITVTSVTIRDCVNAPVPADAGGTANLSIDNTLPTAIGDLAAAQVKTGNDADGTTKITLTWSAVEAGATVEVYRKGFGSYPEYDDAGGSAPTAPTDPANALSNGWALTSVVASGTSDEVASRDFYYFVAFVTDACGNVSAVSNRTNGTLNYHLGDVTNGITPGVGNNLVNTADISALGGDYGKVLAPGDPVNWLDVGPTTDFSVDALPTTDNVVQFEDLMMFAINYGQVSKVDETLVVAAYDEITVGSPSEVEAGTIIMVPVWMSGAGIIQGMSVELSWNERVVEPVGVETGALLESQGGLALTAQPGVVDVALLGTRQRALSGEGMLAQVMFRVLDEGDPQVKIAKVDARDQDNHRVAIGVGDQRNDVTQAVPRVTALLQNVPNPFNPVTRLSFTLAKPGHVELAIYDVSGRRVRTMLQAHRDSGTYEMIWDGVDAAGAKVSSGIYYMRLTTPDGRYSRPMTLLK